MQNKQTNKQDVYVRFDQTDCSHLSHHINASLSLSTFFFPTLYDYIRSRTKAKENCVIITAQGPGFYHTAKISSGNMCEGPAGDFIITLI